VSHVHALGHFRLHVAGLRSWISYIQCRTTTPEAGLLTEYLGNKCGTLASLCTTSNDGPCRPELQSSEVRTAPHLLPHCDNVLSRFDHLSAQTAFSADWANRALGGTQSGGSVLAASFRPVRHTLKLLPQGGDGPVPRRLPPLIDQSALHGNNARSKRPAIVLTSINPGIHVRCATIPVRDRRARDESSPAIPRAGVRERVPRQSVP
jgi:hypothetical protein